jgi:short-subunit dehydrogenase
MPLPVLSAYSGTKCAVLSMTRVWRAEGALHGVGFTAVCPGMMKTNLKNSLRIAGAPPGPLSVSARADRFISSDRYDPANVAEAIVRAVEKNKSVVPVGRETHLVDFMDRISRRFVDLVLKISMRFGDRRF